MFNSCTSYVYITCSLASGGTPPEEKEGRKRERAGQLRVRQGERFRYRSLSVIQKCVAISSASKKMTIGEKKSSPLARRKMNINKMVVAHLFIHVYIMYVHAWSHSLFIGEVVPNAK